MFTKKPAAAAPEKPAPPKKKKGTPASQPAWKGIANQMMGTKC